MSETVKKIVSVVLVFSTLFVMFAFEAGATFVKRETNYDDEISLCWNNVIDSYANLSFSNGKIVGTIRLYGNVGTKYKNGTIKIDRYTGSSWVNVKTWSNQSATTKNFNFSTNTLSAVSGAKYRLTIEITAYNGSSFELISLSKTSTNS